MTEALTIAPDDLAAFCRRHGRVALVASHQWAGPVALVPSSPLCWSVRREPAMSIRFELPADIEEQVRASGADPIREAKEAYLVQLYRRDRITHHQLGRALGLGRAETDGLLKRHGVMLDLTEEEVRAEAASLRDVRPG